MKGVEVVEHSFVQRWIERRWIALPLRGGRRRRRSDGGGESGGESGGGERGRIVHGGHLIKRKSAGDDQHAMTAVPSGTRVEPERVRGGRRHRRCAGRAVPTWSSAAMRRAERGEGGARGGARGGAPSSQRFMPIGIPLKRLRQRAHPCAGACPH